MVEEITLPPFNQASTSNSSPHTLVTSAQPGVITQQRQRMNNFRMNGSQVDPIQTSTSIAPIAPNKLVNTPLNIMEKIKKTNVSIPMWDVLAIPSQRELPDIKL